MPKAILQFSEHLSLLAHPFLVRQESSLPDPTFESDPNHEKDFANSFTILGPFCHFPF